MSGPKSVFDPPAPKVLGRRGDKPNTLGRKGKYRVAAAGREIMSEEQYMRWLREMMAGRDPDQKRDADGNPVVPAGGFVAPISERARMKAAEMFGNRCYGQAPQSVLVEQELHVRGKVDHVLSTPQIRDMASADKNQMREILRRAKNGAPALPAGDPPAD